MSQPSFTGRSRRRSSRRGVVLADKVSRLVITLGGLGTIATVVLICGFLVYVAYPLFLAADADPAPTVALPPTPDAETAPLVFHTDEYRLLAWMLEPDGTFRTVALADGRPLGTARPFGEERLTTAAFVPGSDLAAFGFADGSVRLGEVELAPRFLEDDEVPAGIAALEVGASAPYEGGMIQRTPEGQLRLQELRIEIGEPTDTGLGSGVHALDVSDTPAGKALAVLTDDGLLAHFRVREKKNLMTGKVRVSLRRAEVPYTPPPGRGLPDHLLLSGLGDAILLAWSDGTTIRFDTRDPTTASIAERVDLVEPADGRLTALAYLLGKKSLLVADSTGRVAIWFRTRRAPDATVDGFQLTHAYDLRGRSEDPVVAIAPSSRSQLVAAATEAGHVALWYPTSHNKLVEVATDPPLSHVALSPREDGIDALGGGRIHRWDLDPKYPAITLESLFTPVWYEGMPGPEHTWQSTGGTDDFEPKYGMMPLVYGTLKATFYSLLFGVPIALLAAIFTSEFLPSRARTSLKSVVEIMAGLPSVVLGFLAALVIAPIVQRTVPAVLTSFLTIPFAFLLGAYTWQLLPQRWSVRLAGLPRFAFLGLALGVGILLARLLGPGLERWLFEGDILGWLDHRHGDATGGWLLLCLPLCGAFSIVAMGRWGKPWVRRLTTDWGRLGCATADLVRFALGGLLVLGLAWGMAEGLTALGLDPRGEASVLGRYIQRNALVVGFVMGFAIIPIIYTLAEDALSSVPSHLREGSLGAGATPWQTATRIVVPTAMSGLFSAVMIGMGRAVGETMIVLMAAGNTPIMDPNLFNGFRTLSANIAVELPEADRGGAHYRTLFLAGLVLFAMTFVVNTVAEIVRLRFRARGKQL